jgi:hypothetical protein
MAEYAAYCFSVSRRRILRICFWNGEGIFLETGYVPSAQHSIVTRNLVLSCRRTFLVLGIPGLSLRGMNIEGRPGAQNFMLRTERSSSCSAICRVFRLRLGA